MVLTTSSCSQSQSLTSGSRDRIVPRARVLSRAGGRPGLKPDEPNVDAGFLPQNAPTSSPDRSTIVTSPGRPRRPLPPAASPSGLQVHVVDPLARTRAVNASSPVAASQTVAAVRRWLWRSAARRSSPRWRARRRPTARQTRGSMADDVGAAGSAGKWRRAGRSVRSLSPVSGSQTVAEPSVLLATRRRPSGVNAALPANERGGGKVRPLGVSGEAHVPDLHGRDGQISGHDSVAVG